MTIILDLEDYLSHLTSNVRGEASSARLEAKRESGAMGETYGFVGLA